MQADREISGEELRARIKRLGMTYTLAAERLGLTLAGLNKQMRGERQVSRQTAIILHMIELQPLLNQEGGSTPMNPKRTLELLDELQKLGFTNEAFWRLHHLREKEKRDTINAHYSYCEKTNSFRDDGNSERVQTRLEIVLKYYKAYHHGTPEAFTRLADAAYCMVPALPF
jgi:transcriptional regulator with XRE-family HTH domain